MAIDDDPTTPSSQQSGGRMTNVANVIAMGDRMKDRCDVFIFVIFFIVQRSLGDDDFFIVADNDVRCHFSSWWPGRSPIPHPSIIAKVDSNAVVGSPQLLYVSTHRTSASSADDAGIDHWGARRAMTLSLPSGTNQYRGVRKMCMGGGEVLQKPKLEKRSEKIFAKYEC